MINQHNLIKFDEIYNKTYDKTLKYVICKCSNIDDVNDIIQDIYFELYKILTRNSKIDNIETYLIGIARNKVNKYYGIFYKFKTISLFSKINDLELQDTIKSDINLEKIIITKDDYDRVWKYLKTKKVIISKIFYLYYVLDLTIKEVALELDLKESYVKSIIYRNLKEIKDLLRKEDPNG